MDGASTLILTTTSDVDTRAREDHLMNGQLDLALTCRPMPDAWQLAGGQRLYSLSLFHEGHAGGPSGKQLAAEPTSNLWQARLSQPGVDSSLASAASRRSGVANVWGIPITITNGEFFDDRPRWSPDGRIIYFLSKRWPMNLWARRFDPCTERRSARSSNTTLTHPSGMIPTRMAQLGQRLPQIV
jgi:hypothetical protein